MDKISKEERSQVMASIKAQDTKVEVLLFELLEERGVRQLERHSRDILGKPDLAHRESKTAIFVDGCFWHGCRKHFRKPKSRQHYWLPKIERNRTRDKSVNAQLALEGWQVFRVWEHALQNPRTLQWWVTRISNVIFRQSQLF